MPPTFLWQCGPRKGLVSHRVFCPTKSDCAVGALKKEPFSFGRGSVFLGCLTVCLSLTFGVRMEIELNLKKEGASSCAHVGVHAWARSPDRPDAAPVRSSARTTGTPRAPGLISTPPTRFGSRSIYSDSESIIFRIPMLIL
eukprot:9162035-Pyramimonas_sp.AAC.1